MDKTTSSCSPAYLRWLSNEWRRSTNECSLAKPQEPLTRLGHETKQLKEYTRLIRKKKEKKRKERSSIRTPTKPFNVVHFWRLPETYSPNRNRTEIDSFQYDKKYKKVLAIVKSITIRACLRCIYTTWMKHCFTPNVIWKLHRWMCNVV